jgi:hypothetical protein
LTTTSLPTLENMLGYTRESTYSVVKEPRSQSCDTI